MKEKFNVFLKSGLSTYDAKYLNSYDFVMLLSKGNIINSYFSNVSCEYFIEYPDENKEYNSAVDVLNEEMNLTNSEYGISYENKNNSFHIIAYSEANKNLNK